MNYVDDAELGMEEVIENLDKRLMQIRAGRANPSMLNGIEVESYGTMMPINSVANITIPEAREIMIKPFDRSLLKNIEKGIQESKLGINPTNNGEVIILTLPEMTEDARKDYVKQAKTMGEEAKVALRNTRAKTNNDIKAAKLPEDEEKKTLEKVQDLINKYNKVVDEKLKEKEKELMSI